MSTADMIQACPTQYVGKEGKTEETQKVVETRMVMHFPLDHSLILQPDPKHAECHLQANLLV